jgi:hypothetical protein
VERHNTLILPLVQYDLKELAANVREADRKEIEGVTGQKLEAILPQLLTESREANKIVCDGEMLAVVGDSTHSQASGIGVPWLISTKAVHFYPLEFLRACKPLPAQMLEHHVMLGNYVAAENKDAVRWLAWLGFKIHPAVPYGHSEALSHPFTMIREE